MDELNAWASLKVAPAALLMLEPESDRAPPPVKVLPLQVVVPPRLSVRPADMERLASPMRASPPLVLVTPAPVMPPPDQVVRPETETVPVPPSMPLLRLRGPIVATPWSESVPPATDVPAVLE